MRDPLSGSMIKSIIFDIGGVLVNIHPDRTYQYLSDTTDIDVKSIESRFPWDAHCEYERGRITNREWFEIFRDSLPQPCCLKEKDFWYAWRLLLGQEKSTAQLLKQISNNYSTWLLSNTNPKHIQDEIEKRYLFPNLVDGAIYSFDVDCRKPEEKIYRILLNQIGIKPEQCVFIDDLIDNVHAAEKVGIIGIHFLSYDHLIDDLLKIGVSIS